MFSHFYTTTPISVATVSGSTIDDAKLTLGSGKGKPCFISGEGKISAIEDEDADEVVLLSGLNTIIEPGTFVIAYNDGSNDFWEIMNGGRFSP